MEGEHKVSVFRFMARLVWKDGLYWCGRKSNRNGKVIIKKKKKKCSFLQSFLLLTGLHIRSSELWTRAKLKLSEDLLPAESRGTWGRHHQNSNDGDIKAFSFFLWSKSLPASWNQTKKKKKGAEVFKGLMWTSSRNFSISKESS